MLYGINWNTGSKKQIAKKSSKKKKYSEKQYNKLNGVEYAQKMKWTNEMKLKAKKALLKIANHYEVKPLKKLSPSKLIFTEYGLARYIGKAHDYSVWSDSL